MNAADKGAKALEAGKADEAVIQYSAAIAQNPTAVSYHIQRSIAYTRSKPPKHELALQDAEKAVALAHKRGTAELIASAQLRRAISLYSLNRFADCLECLNWSEKRNSKEKSIMIWRMKTEDKLEALSDGDENGKATVTEIPEINLEAKEASVEKPTTKAGEDSSATPSAATPNFTPPSKIRHDWYQSNETVTISLMAKGVPKETAVVDIQPGSLSISYPLPTGSDYDFSLEPLFAKIVPEASSYKVMSTKVEFILKKATPGQKWATLEGSAPIQVSSEGAVDSVSEAVRQAALSQAAPASAPAYPTSSRSGPKNWDRLADDLTKKKKKAKDDNNEKADEDDDFDYDYEGGDDVNNFFKKLYRNADPDTQRAMMKSYVESNGTALSTNWGEVEHKEYETQPPDGMVAKKW